VGILIGIDLGTTHCKAIGFKAEGDIFHTARFATPASHPKPGWAEHPAEELWSAIAAGIRDVVRKAKEEGEEILAVGVAGMAEAGLLIDRDMRPLTEIHAWYDKRPEPYVAWWNEEGRSDRVYRSAGIAPTAKCPLLKLQWIRDHQTGVFEKAWKWLHAPDYIAHRLTGEIGTDFSLAGRTFAFDIHERRWNPQALEIAGVPESLFPEVYKGDSPVGLVTAKAAEATGLPAGIPVVIGGHDHICGAAAVGALESGAVVDSMGTAESLVGVVDRLPLDAIKPGGYSYGCHVTGDRHYVMGSFSASGASIEWWIDRLYSDQSGDRGGGRYRWLLDLLDRAPEGPTGVLFLPYLRGSAPPGKNPNATGALLGLRDGVDAATLMKAVLEGLACEYRRALENMPIPARGEVIAIGGGTRNPHLMRIKAAVAGRSLVAPQVDEAVAQGAALQAGVAAGVYANLAQAAEAAYRDARRVEPDPGLMDRYDRWYREVYLQAVRDLEGMHGALKRFNA